MSVTTRWMSASAAFDESLGNSLRVREDWDLTDREAWG